MNNQFSSLAKEIMAYLVIEDSLGSITINHADMVVKIIEALQQAYSNGLEDAAEIANEKIPYHIQIPCPDGKPGCSVYHTVPGTRDKTAKEIITAISSKKDKEN